MNTILFLNLLIVHFFADFYLQTDKWCAHKEVHRVGSWFLYFHALLMGVLSWLVVWQTDFWSWAIFITLTHLVIDAIKSYMKPRLWSFLLDQFLHILVLAIVAICDLSVILWYNMFDSGYMDIILVLFLAILICLKPTNIFIKLILDKYRIGVQPECKEIKNAGALIGNLERILTLAFVCVGHWEAVGFIIAAKSLLRFKDTDTAKTEYVLAGTFLSFGIAVLAGIGVKELVLN